MTISGDGDRSRNAGALPAFGNAAGTSIRRQGGLSRDDPIANGVANKIGKGVQFQLA
jgi:hypothetical protein